MSMHRVCGGFTIGSSCRLICAIDKSQLAMFTYYSLFAAQIICRRLSCFRMRYQSVVQYSISIPGSITSLSYGYVMYVLDFDDATSSGYRNNHGCEHHVRSHNFAAIDWIAKSGNTGGTSFTIGGKKRSATEIIRVRAEL